MRDTQRHPCSTTLGSLLDSTFSRVGITSRTTGNESGGRLRQQLAAVVTAVRWVLVGKKSRYVKHAVSPPSRTIDAGKSTEILARVYICYVSVCTQRALTFQREGPYTESLLGKINELDVQELLAQDGNGTPINHISYRAPESLHQVRQAATG